MKKVALVIDNSAGMSQEDIDKLNVAKVIPISFMVNGDEYYENVNMSYSQFFEFLEDKNCNVSTSQPSIEFVKESWREVLSEYDELVYLLLSSGLSEACNAAMLASQDDEFKGRVFVVDNGGVSLLNKVPMFVARYMINQNEEQYVETFLNPFFKQMSKLYNIDNFIKKENHYLAFTHLSNIQTINCYIDYSPLKAIKSGYEWTVIFETDDA